MEINIKRKKFFTNKTVKSIDNESLFAKSLIACKNCRKRAWALSCASKSADYLSKLFNEELFQKCLYHWNKTRERQLRQDKRRAHIKKKLKISKLPHSDFSKLFLASSFEPFEPFARWFFKPSANLWQSWRSLIIWQKWKFEELIFHKCSLFSEFFLLFWF